jgi:hypothetical protein
MKITGRFYFKKTQSGNLLGEFSNNATSKNYTESADLCRDDRLEIFEGTYFTTWQENGSAEFAELVISRVNLIFSLKWTVANAGHFSGEGFLVDGMLVGNYRD